MTLIKDYFNIKITTFIFNISNMFDEMNREVYGLGFEGDYNAEAKYLISFQKFAFQASDLL